MRLFVSSPRVRKKPGSLFAVAIALATGTAMLSGVVAEPAQAQREKKDRKKKDERPQYSEEFVAAFVPLQEALNAEGADSASLVGQIPGVVAVSQSPDEKFATGGLVYNAGARTQNRDIQLQGVELMLESGKAAPEEIGRFNFIGYQFTNAKGEFATSRQSLQRAMDANFSTGTIDKKGMRNLMSESFISEGRFAEGLDYLAQAIETIEDEGGEVEESWFRRGVGIGYNNEVVPQVYGIAGGWASNYPSPANWRDAINIARNLNEFEFPETLDLMRLSFRVNGIKEKYEFADYVEAADPRRLPKEVKRVIESAYERGLASRDDIFLADSLTTANGRIASDEAELPALESDARAADAGLRTVMAAGDTFLSYSQYEKAEEFYNKVLGMAGVNRPVALTRLGIAQLELGKLDEARASFAQVDGVRLPIGILWGAYADQLAAEAATAAPAPVEAETVAPEPVEAETTATP